MKIEQQTIQSENAELYSEIYIPNIVPASALLICHGMNSRGHSGLRLYTKLAEEACKTGLVTLLFDFRGVGKSTGMFDYGISEKHDVKCAVNYLASRPEVLSDRIFIVGHSLGGVVSLYAILNEMHVKGIVLWATPKKHSYNVRKYILNTKGRLGLYGFYILSWLDKIFNVTKIYKLKVYGVQLRPRYVKDKLMQLNACEASSKLNIPLLIVIGDRDKIVGVDEAQEIYRSANEPKSLMIINSDHIFVGKEKELVTKTLEWIKGIQ